FVVAAGRKLGAASALDIDGRPLGLGTDWTPHGGSRSAETRGEVVFLGYGISAPGWDDWTGDVRDKIVVVLDGVPSRLAAYRASGTAVVVGLAGTFAAAGGAARTLVIALFGAEELGLVGSRHYVRHPAWPLARTVAMLNFDMVGRMQDGKLSIGGADTGDRLR